MAKTFVTAHIKLEDHVWGRLIHEAENRDLSTAQLVRRILTNWLDGQVIVEMSPEGPVTAEMKSGLGRIAP